MNEQRRQAPRLWLSLLVLVALIGGPILLYVVLPRTGVPAAIASGVVAVIAIKHLGLLAAALAPLYLMLRRRPRP